MLWFHTHWKRLIWILWILSIALRFKLICLRVLSPLHHYKMSAKNCFALRKALASLQVFVTTACCKNALSYSHHMHSSAHTVSAGETSVNNDFLINEWFILIPQAVININLISLPLRKLKVHRFLMSKYLKVLLNVFVKPLHKVLSTMLLFTAKPIQHSFLVRKVIWSIS